MLPAVSRLAGGGRREASRVAGNLPLVSVAGFTWSGLRQGKRRGTPQRYASTTGRELFSSVFGCFNTHRRWQGRQGCVS